MANRKIISKEELQEILDSHKAWTLDENNGEKADLSGVNLQNIELCGINLKGANLRNMDLSFSRFEDINLSDSDLSGSDIVKANWKAVNLSNANLDKVDLRETEILQGPFTSTDENLSRHSHLDGASFFQANLSNTTLTKAHLAKANFIEATLEGTNFCDAILIGANFSNAKMNKADFSKANLIDVDISGAHITNAKFEQSNITGIKYNGSLKQSEYVKFRGARVETSYGSPVFKRFAQDQDYLYEYQNKNPLLFNLWYYTSMCGRSIGAWIFLSFLIALLFGIVYSNYPSWGWYSYISPDLGIVGRSKFTPYYFSIVTFTTLGFGDFTPKNLAGEIWVTLEVVVGYVMLGGLISIFSNKLAQRS